MFTKVKVNSSAIENVSYDKTNHILRLEFKQGVEYDYPEVPEVEFKNLIGAASVGKYFNNNIKKYSTKRVKGR